MYKFFKKVLLLEYEFLNDEVNKAIILQGQEPIDTKPKDEGPT